VFLLSGCRVGAAEQPLTGIAMTPAMMPTFVSSFESLHELLIIAADHDEDRARQLSHENEGQLDVQQAIDNWGLASMKYYYIPMWTPDGFELEYIAITRWAMSVRFYSHDYDKNYDVVANFCPSRTHAHLLNNSIVFEWSRLEQGDQLMRETIENAVSPGVYYKAVDGMRDMYYHDFAAYPFDGLYIRRNFVWLQDGYRFSLSIPLRIIQSNGIVPQEIPALIVSSAQRVYVEDMAVSQ